MRGQCLLHRFQHVGSPRSRGSGKGSPMQNQGKAQISTRSVALGNSEVSVFSVFPNVKREFAYFNHLSKISDVSQNSKATLPFSDSNLPEDLVLYFTQKIAEPVLRYGPQIFQGLEAPAVHIMRMVSIRVRGILLSFCTWCRSAATRCVCWCWIHSLCWPGRY